MFRIMNLVMLFYGPVFLFNTAISLFCAVVALFYGGASYAVAIFFLCFFTAGFVFGLWGNHRLLSMEYMFYANAGVSLRKLLAGSAILNTITGVLLNVFHHFITGGLS